MSMCFAAMADSNSGQAAWNWGEKQENDSCLVTVEVGHRKEIDLESTRCFCRHTDHSIQPNHERTS